MKLAKIALLLLFWALLLLGYHIFVPAAYSVKSISNLFFSLCKLLADKGHQITFVTAYEPSSGQYPNIDIYMLGQELQVYDETNYFGYREMENKFEDTTGELIAKVASLFHADQRIKDLWEQRHSFDMIITEAYFHEMVYPFLIDFNGSLVHLCSAGFEIHCLIHLGNVTTPSVLPSMYMNSDHYMDFWGRMYNLLSFRKFYKFLRYKSIVPIEGLIQKLYPEMGMLASYSNRVDLTLINSHFALEFPIPLLPNQIEIGCLDCRTAKTLPKELKDFADGSGDAGIIYFSLGSSAKSSDIPQKAMTAFLDAFSQIPQRVIFKYEGNTSRFSSNVLTAKWLPQQDILGHPKTKVFISHCGVRGMQEAKFHGVPILGVPITLDQPRNAAQVEKAGQAIVLQWEEITTKLVLDSLNKLIYNHSYKTGISKVSKLLKDQRESPAERAILWIEYVLRHKGAPHLQYAGKQLNIFQYLLLDVILFWFGLLGLSLLLAVACLKFIFRTKKRIKHQNHKCKQG